MKKLFVETAIVLLSSLCLFTQSSSQATQQPGQSQTSTSDQGAHTVEGCLTGAADTFVLTDAAGKRYELTGDTKMLEPNVGHKVRLWGNAGNTGGGELITPNGPQATFGVKKVKSLSDSCK